MPETDDLDSLLTLGAVIAEETGLRARRHGGEDGDDLYVLASALAWAALRRLWQGEDRSVLRRWRDDIPDAMERYAERTGTERL